MPASVSGKVEYGLENGTVIVWVSTFLIPKASIPCMSGAATPALFGLTIRLSVKIKSSAVRSSPLWKVTPLRRRIVHRVAS